MLSWLAEDFKGGSRIAATGRMRSGTSKVPGLQGEKFVTLVQTDLMVYGRDGGSGCERYRKVSSGVWHSFSWEQERKYGAC